MEDKSDWILGLLKRYQRETSQKPVFISDWNALNDQALYPKKLIRNALNIDTSLTLPYTFSDEQHSIKQLIVDNFADRKIDIACSQIAISISATAALYLSLVSLYKEGCRRFLLFTPVYYAVVETLKDLNADIIFYHLTDGMNFEIDLLKFRQIMETNKVDVVLISDPVYCVGKNIRPVILKDLGTLCKKNNSWLVVDNTLGGLEWNKNGSEIFSYEKIKELLKLENFVFVDSLTKRMLINALKHAVILTSARLAEKIEDFASQVYGGFCYPQLQLMAELYDKNNATDIISMLGHNVQIIRDNYELLKGFLAETDFDLYNADSGYFTMIANRQHICSEVNIEAQVSGYLYKHNTFLLPPWYFHFDASNRFSIRVNLLNDTSTYLSALGKCIRENVKLLH